MTHVDLPIYIGSVPTAHLGDFNEKLKTSFNRIVEHGLDMERMAMVINRDERQVISTSFHLPVCLNSPIDNNHSFAANWNLPKATRFLALL